ncbi:MAG TPA: hypothetical protein VHT30_12410 [Acidimicrobiales bacterium]|jgi:hypothetical protein|nr:hypothetical protein [Acidimicrobiales bacterium]
MSSSVSVLLAVIRGASPTTTLPSASSDLFGGTTSLLQLLVLAFAGALVVGNVLALVRPPSRVSEKGSQGPPARPAMTRSVVMITIGMVVVIWVVASLLRS